MDDRASQAQLYRTSSILVIGLGNPVLGDDALGWHAAKQVEGEIKRAGYCAKVVYLAVGGIGLMESMVGYKQVLLIDAVFTGKQPLGSVCLWSLDDLADTESDHLNSTHDMTLQTALALGRGLGLPLPEEIFIFGVETEHVYSFSESLTPPVLAAMPTLVRKVLEFLYPSLQEEIQT